LKGDLEKRGRLERFAERSGSILRSIYMKIWDSVGARFEFGQGVGQTLDRVGRPVLAKINCQKLKILLAMTIDSDSYGDSGVSPGTVSRSYVGKNLSICLCFERLLRSALRGDGLPFRRVGGERAGFA
jgi:hypothetical protein